MPTIHTLPADIPDTLAAAATPGEDLNTTTVREARAKYFAENNFGDDGGYSAKWTPLKFGPVTLMLYNSKARQRAVPLHDLHHIATGYPTTPKGEAQIAIWELAAGTFDKWFAFFINVPALLYGFVLWPRASAEAWRRGRSSNSLYHREFEIELLELSVDELRAMTVGETP